MEDYTYYKEAQFSLLIPDQIVNQGFTPQDLVHVMLNHFEPADAAVAEAPTEPDFIDFYQVQDFHDDLVAALKMHSKVSDAILDGTGVKLSFRQTRVLGRILERERVAAHLWEKDLQSAYHAATGHFFDHDKWNTEV